MRGTGHNGRARRALVTGANGGIGAAIVERLRTEGYHVVTTDIAPPADYVLDLAHDLVPEDLGAEVDVCISNAAITNTLSPAHRMSADKWQRDIDVNLTGAFRIVQACLGGMRARRYGRIVLISSLAATAGGRGQVAYSASKAGLLGMAATIASENVAHGITVNSVLPGLIATPTVRAMPAEVLAAVGDRLLPSGRMGEPDEVAALVAFLAAAEAGYITAQQIAIDGGAHLSNISLGAPDKSL